MKTIMLIDDDPTMLKLLQTLLRIEGFNPVPWSRMGDIIAETVLTDPEIVLLDVNLRNANGIEILKQMRATEALAHLPVIMTSGIDYRAESREAGANDFITKPYMPDVLVRSIRSHLMEEV
ncbi:MAG TPA: response regulator [Anaerolineales bacterium]|nr:response regulator [Anaerolineales bacterium]